MAMSAYLISKAAIVSNVAEIALAITSVRVLAIGRAAFRYLERYVTHRATFAILADLRVWFFASIEPLAPARLATRRSGDLLARIVADIETLEDFYVRIIVPPVVAVLVTAFASVLLGVFDPLLGLVLAAFLVLTGVVLPVASRRLSRRPAIALVASRAELSAMLVDEIGGIADLVAMDRAADHRERVLALGRATDRATAELAARARRRGRPGRDVREPGVGDDPGHRRPARRRGAARRRLPRAPAARRARQLRGHRAAVAGVRAARRQRGRGAPPVRADRRPRRRSRTRRVSTRRRSSPATPSSSGTCASATGRTSRTSSTAARSPSRPARASRSSGRAGWGSRRWSTCCCGSGTTTRARS